MDKYYLGQSSLDITVSFDDDITGASVLIEYRKPDGIEGSWAATIVEVLPACIYYACADGDIDAVGKWTLWLHITYADGRDAYSEPFYMRVYTPGT